MTSAAKWARGLSVSGSVRLVTCGDRSLTRCADRDVTDAQLSAWLKLNVQKELWASVCFSPSVCVLHSVRENMKWVPALQRERGHASCFSPQRQSPEGGQWGRAVRVGSSGAWHSHNTSGICDVTLHLSNEISFSYYNTPTHTYMWDTFIHSPMVRPLKSSNLRLPALLLHKSTSMWTALVKNKMC